MTEKSSIYNDYFSKLFKIWEEALSENTGSTLKNDLLQNSPKLKKDKINELNDYMKDIMSKNISEKYLGFDEDIELLNNSIEKVHVQLDIIKKKIDKLTNTDTAKDTNKSK
ncbi:MAG: hypothetical protein GTN99_01930 [Candidatus Dadabacteria bacterium]|nr:hypothetical protein [Candidatus Dadabacteria bacterium]NIT13029.1 hypothetical protein [Candidatus Dadabacteria bacterium]